MLPLNRLDLSGVFVKSPLQGLQQVVSPEVLVLGPPLRRVVDAHHLLLLDHWLS